MWCWRRLLRIPWTAKRTNKYVLDTIKPEVSLESKILKQKLQYFGHVMRNDTSLEKTIMLGNMQVKSKAGRQRMRWIEEVEKSTQMNLIELGQIKRNRNAWRALIWNVTRSRKRLVGTYREKETATLGKFGRKTRTLRKTRTRR
ncbi:hypothetical protein BsWGS_18437 [Bradybaena similaris]